MMKETHEFQRVAAVAEIPAETGRSIMIGKHEIALFNRGGSFYAISNMCPHRGAPLHEGFLEGERVICPWHCFDFNLHTGRCETVPGLKVKIYEVKVEEGEVFVRC
jgi:NAD(P)H-dependent nitrite reductase small subunit